jgi:thiol-disulfide isomerase/thioredoxin|tara:strand:- start:459 stop:827 length:369 start_codon:yes stop_codon:yes gene_type:complete
MSVQRIDRNSVKKILDGYIKREHSVVIKFYSSNCGLCHNLAPFFQELSRTHEDVLFYAFNMEDGDGFEEKYDFEGVPTICCVKTKGTKTTVKFVPEPEDPDGGEDGQWYHPAELNEFISQNT